MLIRLTLAKGEKILINPDHIRCVEDRAESMSPANALIKMQGGDQYHVIESLEEIEVWTTQEYEVTKNVSTAN